MFFFFVLLQFDDPNATVATIIEEAKKMVSSDQYMYVACTIRFN